MTGRATGPHLCWRLKWRDRNLDPSLLVGARAPRRLA
jgi:murein DD-endopeptidase MepM/ murein hydrolase activator NlpD